MARDRSKTIESLRRVAERPGSPNEGEIARRLLEQLGAIPWTAIPFQRFPKGTRVFYCYWCYRNSLGFTVSDEVKEICGEKWMRIQFFDIKRPRWVPVTSPLGFHLSETPFAGDTAETLYRMDLDWKRKDEEFAERLRTLMAKPQRIEGGADAA